MSLTGMLFLFLEKKSDDRDKGKRTYRRVRAEVSVNLRMYA